MTEFLAIDPPVGHIPGAGIDFAAVGLVHVVGADQVGAALPRTAMPGVRLAAPERLLPVVMTDTTTVDHVAVGDLVVTLSVSAGTAHLGRPMQVVHRNDSMTVVLDDQSVPPSISIKESMVSSIKFGEVAAGWHVLAAFGIGRCPRCQSPGQELIHGLFVGEPSAGYVAAGCFVPWLAADLRCPRYHAEWPLSALDDVVEHAE